MKRTKLTHDEHVEFAKKVRALDLMANTVMMEVSSIFGKKLGGKAWRVTQAISRLKSALDTEYHSVTSDEQFIEHGHVYYGGHDADA